MAIFYNDQQVAPKTGLHQHVELIEGTDCFLFISPYRSPLQIIDCI